MGKRRYKNKASCNFTLEAELYEKLLSECGKKQMESLERWSISRFLVLMLENYFKEQDKAMNNAGFRKE